MFGGASRQYAPDVTGPPEPVTPDTRVRRRRPPRVDAGPPSLHIPLRARAMRSCRPRRDAAAFPPGRAVMTFASHPRRRAAGVCGVP